MLYPILKVVQYATGARQLVWLLEEVIIRVLTYWGIAGVRVSGKPGVWVMVPQLQKIGFGRYSNPTRRDTSWSLAQR